MAKCQYGLVFVSFHWTDKTFCVAFIDKIAGDDLHGHMPCVSHVVNKHNSKCCSLDRATPDHAVQCYHHAEDRGSYQVGTEEGAILCWSG